MAHRYDNTFHVINDIGEEDGLHKGHLIWALNDRGWPIPKEACIDCDEGPLQYSVAGDCCDDGEFTELMNQAWVALNEKPLDPELEKLI